MTPNRLLALLVRSSFATTLLLPSLAHADRSRDEHRYFRALTIDLSGRIPTREEIATFEDPAFDVDKFIEARIVGDAYSERLQRVYMDALRLDLGDAFLFRPPNGQLVRYAVPVRETDGTVKNVWVYYRIGQARTDPATNRGFCFTAADTGQTYMRNRSPLPETPTKSVPRATFDARTVKVKPWWLYRDYRGANPTDYYTSWTNTQPRQLLLLPNERTTAATAPNDPRLLIEAEGGLAHDVYVCNEEAQANETATAIVQGQSTTVSCHSDLALGIAPTCGCGKGLEWCQPVAGFAVGGNSFILPSRTPLGPKIPFEMAHARASEWNALAWTEEALHFFDEIFGGDRDFREVLTARYGFINGPLSQFYRQTQAFDATDQLTLGPGATYATPETIFDVSKIPDDLKPWEMERWVKVNDRGPRAAGLLTLPAFLGKFASRRGRANAVYNAFLCKEFISDNVNLQPSSEPNLMKRPGCSTCHAKLEPLAAYFTRTKESSFSWISAPIQNPQCKLVPGAEPTVACGRYYDPSFSTTSNGELRGAYGSTAHAEAGPRGLAQEVVKQPEFSACAVRTVSESLLGRKLTGAADDALLTDLDKTFVQGGYKMRALVRAVLKSDAYRYANSTVGGAQ